MCAMRTRRVDGPMQHRTPRQHWALRGTPGSGGARGASKASWRPSFSWGSGIFPHRNLQGRQAEEILRAGSKRAWDVRGMQARQSSSALATVFAGPACRPLTSTTVAPWRFKYTWPLGMTGPGSLRHAAHSQQE